MSLLTPRDPVATGSASWSRRRVLQLAAFGMLAAAGGALADALARALSAGPGYSAIDARSVDAGSPAPSGGATSSAPVATPDGHSRYRSRPDLEAPPITVTRRDRGLVPGLVFLTPGDGPAPDGPMIATDAGEPVWLHPRGSLQVTNLRVGRYRGQPVLTWWEGKISPGGIGAGEFVIADAAYREVARVRAANGLEGDLHEFFIGPEDTAILLATNLVTGSIPTPTGSKPGPVIEAVIQEIDIASGRLVFEWHSFPAIDPAESQLPPPTDGSPYDYMHANSLDLTPDGGVILSARHPWCVYKIGRPSGEVVWRLSGQRSDFSLEPDAVFAWQHDVRSLADGRLTIFDNGARDPDPGDPNSTYEQHSRGLVLELDEQAMTARLVQEFSHPDGLLATSQGSFQLYPDGRAFLGWGIVPHFSEFDRAGLLRLDASFPTRGSYRALRYPWVGRPALPPAAAAIRAADGTAVYASWNGATAVAAWQVLGGPDAAHLTPVARAPRTGFETVMLVGGAYGSVAVRALDAHGAVLGASEPVPVA